MPDRRRVVLKDVIVIVGLLGTLATAVVGLVHAGITIGSQQQTISDLVRRVTVLEDSVRYFHGEPGEK